MKETELLKSWVLINSKIMNLTIENLQDLIVAELDGMKRPNVLLRLYGRFNKLRTEREKNTLMRGKLPWG